MAYNQDELEIEGKAYRYEISFFIKMCCARISRMILCQWIKLR